MTMIRVFVCSGCGEEFESELSEEQVREEALKEFSEEELARGVETFCHECYLKRKAEKDSTE